MKKFMNIYQNIKEIGGTNMDKYLFHGKCKGTGEWAEGNLVGDCVIIPKGQEFEIEGPYIIFSDLMTVEVYPESVGQYTGMNDIKGQRIFEGDIM